MSRAISDNDIIDILSHTQRIAAVGLSDDSDAPSYRVARNLSEAGYDIVPVDATRQRAFGKRTADDLRAVHGRIGIVLVFEGAKHIDQIANDCVSARARALWLQPGAVDETAAGVAADAGVRVVCDRYIHAEYQRLLG